MTDQASSIRELQAQDHQVAVNPTYGHLLNASRLEGEQLVHCKGDHFDIQELLLDQERAERFCGESRGMVNRSCDCERMMDYVFER